MKNHKRLLFCFLALTISSIQFLQAQDETDRVLYADGKEVNLTEGFSLNALPQFISIQSETDSLDAASEVILYIARGAQVHLEKSFPKYADLTSFNLKEWMKELQEEDRLLIIIKFSKLSEEEEEMNVKASSEKGDIIYSIPISK